MINSVNMHTYPETTVTACMLDNGAQYLEFATDIRTVAVFVPRDPREALLVLNRLIEAAQTLAGHCHGLLDTFSPAQTAALESYAARPMAGSRIEEL